MDRVYRFNWNGQTFLIENFKKAYKENQGIVLWRHPKNAKVKKGERCLLYFGERSSRAATKKLVGVVGIGKVLDDQEFTFTSTTAPWYLKTLKDKSPKPIETQVFAKIMIYVDFDEALISKKEIDAVFHKGPFWPSGHFGSGHIEDEESAIRLYIMTGEEAHKRIHHLLTFLN